MPKQDDELLSVDEMLRLMEHNIKEASKRVISACANGELTPKEAMSMLMDIAKRTTKH